MVVVAAAAEGGVGVFFLNFCPSSCVPPCSQFGLTLKTAMSGWRAEKCWYKELWCVPELEKECGHAEMHSVWAGLCVFGCKKALYTRLSESGSLLSVSKTTTACLCYKGAWGM